MVVENCSLHLSFPKLISYVKGMDTPPKPYVKLKPPTKDQLREMLALAVRNTLPKTARPVKGPKPAYGSSQMRVIMIAGLGLLLSTCASLSQGAPISPRTYRDFTCAQLVQEGHAISRKGFLLSGLRPGSGGTDTTEANSAVVIVWPTSKHLSAETLSNLKYAKSQIDALEEASVSSQCSIQFLRPLNKQS